MSTNPARHYTAEEVSELLGGKPSPATLLEWARKKQVPHRKIGHFVRWTGEDIEQISNEAHVAPKPFIAQSARSRATTRNRKTA